MNLSWCLSDKIELSIPYTWYKLCSIFVRFASVATHHSVMICTSGSFLSLSLTELLNKRYLQSTLLFRATVQLTLTNLAYLSTDAIRFVIEWWMIVIGCWIRRVLIIDSNEFDYCLINPYIPLFNGTYMYAICCYEDYCNALDPSKFVLYTFNYTVRTIHSPLNRLKCTVP